MNEYKNFRGRGRGPFHFRGPNPNMFNNGRGVRGGNNFGPMLPAPNFRDNKLRWPRPHMNAYNWRPPNINAPAFHHNARFPLLPPPRHPMPPPPPRPMMSKPPPPVISRPLSPLPGSEEARQKAIAEASARIKEQLNLNEGASTLINREITTTPAAAAVNVQTSQCFVSVLPPASHDENQHKMAEKITRKRVRKSTNSVQSVDVEELRKKILTQFTYMSKGKIQSLVNNPGSTRYDAALQHLVRDMRLHLSSELRTMYNNRENEYSKESNEMIDHFNSIVPDLGVELVSLPDTMVAELSKILQLDINNDLEVVPERRSSSGSDCTLVEPEKMFKQAEKLLSDSNFITMHPFDDEVRMSEFALSSRTIDTSASSSMQQQAVETMSENSFLAMNSPSAIFMHAPTTSNYNVNEPVDNLLSESTYLTAQAPTTFLCELDDRTLDSGDQCAQVNTELDSDNLTIIPYGGEQLKTNDYVESGTVCREQTSWDAPCDNMSSEFIEIGDNEIIHIPEPLAIDDTDYTVDNIVFNMDDTNGINMDVTNSNLDTTDLITDSLKSNDIDTSRTDIDNLNVDKSTELIVSNTEFIVNNTNVDLANTNFNLDNTNIDKTNTKPVNTNECNTVQVKQNSVKKKNLINIKLNLNKTNFNVNKANLMKDPSSLTMDDSSSLSLDDITLPPVHFNVNVSKANMMTADCTSTTMNCTNATAIKTVTNTEITTDNMPTRELTVNTVVGPDLNDINHNMNDINPNDEINPDISEINASPDDTDPFLTKNPLFNPPPNTPRIRSCSPDVRFCNPPFEPATTARRDVIHDSPELHATNKQLDIDLLDRIANISATLNKDDTGAIKTVAQHCPSHGNAVNNASTLFDFDSVWISKKNVPVRQTSVNNSGVNSNNTSTTENSAPKRDVKSKQTACCSSVSNKSEENLSRTAVKSINVQHSKMITRSKSHESIYDMTRDRFHDSLSDRVPSVDSSRTSSINHEEKHHHDANSYDKSTDGRHNRYKYNRRCRSKSPTDSHKKYRQSLNERIRNMMTVKNDATDKRKLSKRQQKELYKRKMLDEQSAKCKAKKKRFKVCVASERPRQMSVMRSIRDKQDEVKKKSENVQRRRLENVPKKKTIGVRQKVVETVQIIDVEDEAKSQTEQVQKKNTQKRLMQKLHTQKKHNETVLKKKLELVQTKNANDTQKKTAQNVQNRKDVDMPKKKMEEAQRKNSDSTPKKKVKDTQKTNTGDLQSKRIEAAANLQCTEYPGSYTPPISCVTSDVMAPKDAESKSNSLQSSATGQVVVQSISSVTNNIDSDTADNNKFTLKASVEQSSPVRNAERKLLPGTPVKTPAQKKEYSVDSSPSRKLVGLKRDIEQNITKLAQTVQNILKTNAGQQKLSVAAPLTTSADQLTPVRTTVVTSDNVSESNTEPVKRTVKLTRSKITQNNNTTDSGHVNSTKRPSDTSKSVSNSTVNTSNVKDNSSKVNTLCKVGKQIKENTSERASKTLLKTVANETRDNSIEQTQTDMALLEIKEEPASTSSSSDESNDYLDVDIKEEDESSNKVIDQCATIQESARGVTVTNVVDKVNNKHSADSTNNTEPKCDTAQPDTPIDKTIANQSKENAGNKTQSKEIGDTKQSNKIDNILVETSNSAQKDVNKDAESLSKRTADINTSEDIAKEICPDASTKDESKGKESKDTRHKRTEKASVSKIDKSNKTEKSSSSSRSNSKEKITSGKSVEREKGDKVKRKEVSKTDKPRDRSKESDKRSSSVDKTNVDTVKSTTDEPKTHSEEMKKSKSNSNLPQRKSNKNEDQPKKSTKDKGTNTTTVKPGSTKKPETKTKSTNTTQEKLEKPSSHKESPKKTKEPDKAYSSRKERDKKDSTENGKSIDTRLTSNLETSKESIGPSSVAGSPLSNSAQPIEICIPTDTSCHAKDSILNRLISIDLEIQKLMHEKWNLYKQLQITGLQVPLLMPNIQADSAKACVCTDSSRTRGTMSPSHSEISVGDNVTNTYSHTCRTHLSVTPSESSSTEKESEIPSKKRRLSITLSESSVPESVHIKTPLEPSRMRQLSVTPTGPITINETQQSRAETPISMPIVNQQVSNTPTECSITNDTLQIRDGTSVSVALRTRQLSVTPSESSVTNETSQHLVEGSISETMRTRQVSVTPSESSVTNETLQSRDKTPISDILRLRQLSVTPSESSLTNDNPRKRPLSITPSESSLTEHTESVKNDNDPSDDVDSEMQANKTPKKKRLQKRVTPKRKKKKSTDDLVDPIDVFTEDDTNNDSNANVQKFRVKLPNMKTRNKNRKLLDLFTENEETRLNRSERAVKPDINVTDLSVHVDTALREKLKEAERLAEGSCVKSRHKKNVEENTEQVQLQETMKMDVKTRTTCKTKNMEVKQKELHTEMHSPTLKIRNKNKTKQDKRIHLETAVLQETKHEESHTKQSEIIPATETRARKTSTRISVERNVEQKEEGTRKDDVSRKNKTDETSVIKTRTRTKSRSNCSMETEQSKNEKTQKGNDDAKEDIDKPLWKRLKTSATDGTGTKQTVTGGESSEEDNIPLLVRVATLFKDNEPEDKPIKSKTKLMKHKNKLADELSDICVGMETRRRSTSLCIETIDSKDKSKTVKVTNDQDSTISAALVTDAGDFVENPNEKPESKLTLPVVIQVDTVSNIQRTHSLSKDACVIVAETEQIPSEQPRKVGRPRSKKKVIRKPRLEDISTSEMPIQVQSNGVECHSPAVTTPCFVHLERVNIPAMKPDKPDPEEIPVANPSPIVEILPEVQATIVEEQPVEDTTADTPIVAEISLVDNTSQSMPSTSVTTDDNPSEHHDNNVVQNTVVEPEQNTTNKQDDIIVPATIETETAENVTVVEQEEEEVQNVTVHEEPLPVKEIVEEVDLIGDDGIFCMGHQKSILDLKVIGDEFLAASEDGTIYKYCMKTGSLQDAYTGHKKAVTCMYLVDGSVLNIDSPLLYSGSLDCCLKCYNIDTAETVHHVTVEQAIQCMDSAWGHIFLGTYDGLLFIYNMKKKLLHDQSLTIASATVLMIKATTEGSRQILILASRKREIMVRDAFTGLLLRTMCQEQRPTIYSLYLDRSMVYCGTSDKGILILDFNNGSQIGAYTAGKGVVCMLMYKALLFAGCYDGMIYVYNTRTQRQVKAIAGPGDGMLLSLAISNNIIIAGTKKDHLLKIWKIPKDVLNETLS